MQPGSTWSGHAGVLWVANSPRCGIHGGERRGRVRRGARGNATALLLTPLSNCLSSCAMSPSWLPRPWLSCSPFPHWWGVRYIHGLHTASLWRGCTVQRCPVSAEGSVCRPPRPWLSCSPWQPWAPGSQAVPVPRTRKRREQSFGRASQRALGRRMRWKGQGGPSPCPCWRQSLLSSFLPSGATSPSFQP